MKFFKPSKTRFLPAAAVVALAMLSLFPSVARASTYTVTEESDWYFEIEQDATNVVIYGNSNSACAGSFADPYLWVYDLSGNTLAQNDDGNHNSTDQCVSSKIETTLDAGVYRLRAGYCCSSYGLGSNPSGNNYELVTDLTLATNFSTYNGVRFSYIPAYIEQTIDVSSYAGEIDAIIVTPLVKRFYDVNDYVATQYAAYDSAGNLLQGNITSSAPTSWVEVPSFWFSASTSTNVQDSTLWDTVKIRIWAKDGEGWGGNYGTEIKEVAFKAKLDGSTEWTDLTNLLTNPYFNSINSNSPPDGWSSNASWDTCQGLTSSTLCGFSQNTWGWATPATTTTTTSTTTTVPQTIGPPMNLTGEVTSDGVYLDWDAPNTGNVEPERYAISFRIPPDAGWGVATGNVGDENALNTDYTLPFSLFESTGGLGESYVFDVRADNDTMGIYSGWSTQVTLLVEEVTPSTTTTSTTTTSTTTTVPPTTTAPTTTTTTTSSTTTTIPVTTTTSTTTSTSTSTTTVPETTTTTTTTSTTTTVPPTTTSTTSPPTTTTTTSLPPTTTSTSTTTTTVRPATTTTSSPPTTTPTPPTTTVPVFEDPDDAAVAEELEDLGLDVSPEQVKEIDEAEIKVVEELDAISKELAEEYIDVIDGDVTVDDIKHLVEDDNFKDIPDDAKQTLVVALNEVDDEVKSEFEDAVNIFEDENYNDYVAAGSAITTEDRRTVVAATAAVAATAGAAAGPSGPKTSGGSGGGGGGGSDGPRKRGGSSRRSR